MPDTSPKQWDIFVSYAHLNDDPVGNAQFGIVTTFVEQLKKRLREKLGSVEVWMDHELASNEIVDQTLLSLIRSSRTILLFMSPAYLRSSWCAREINGFLEANQARFHCESVFVIEIDSTDRSAWPRRVQQLSPVRFFDVDLKGRTRTLGWPSLPTQPESPYWSRLNEVAHGIATHLKLMSSESTPTANAARAPSKPKVWIAQPSDGLEQEWESLAGAVRQAGANVLPVGLGVYPLSDASAFKSALTADLLAADLLVHLLGGSSGIELTDSPGQFAVTLQASVARALRPELQPKAMLWRTAELPDGTPSTSDELLPLLELASHENFEVFRHRVVQAVQRLLDPPAPVQIPVGPDRDGLTICVSASEQDQALAGDICRLISDLDAAPIPVRSKPLHDQSPEAFRQQLRELLGNSDGIVLAQGVAPAMWFNSQLAQFRKLLGADLKQRKLWGAFVDGPPLQKDDPVTVYDRNVLTIHCRDGLKRESIADFLRQLRAGDAGV